MAGDAKKDRRAPVLKGKSGRTLGTDESPEATLRCTSLAYFVKYHYGVESDMEKPLERI